MWGTLRGANTVTLTLAAFFFFLGGGGFDPKMLLVIDHYSRPLHLKN